MDSFIGFVWYPRLFYVVFAVFLAFFVLIFLSTMSISWKKCDKKGSKRNWLKIPHSLQIRKKKLETLKFAYPVSHHPLIECATRNKEIWILAGFGWIREEGRSNAIKTPPFCNAATQCGYKNCKSNLKNLSINREKYCLFFCWYLGKGDKIPFWRTMSTVSYLAKKP